MLEKYGLKMKTIQLILIYQIENIYYVNPFVKFENIYYVNPFVKFENIYYINPFVKFENISLEIFQNLYIFFIKF